MEVKYELSRQDYWNYTKLQFIYKPMLRNLLFIYIIFIGIISVQSYRQNKDNIIAFCIFNVLFWILVYNLMRWLIMKLPASKAGLLGEHIIQVTKDGLKESTKVNENTYKWAGIIRILSVKKYIFLYVDNMAAHVIPKRAFENEEEADKFYRYTMQLWAENKEIAH